MRTQLVDGFFADLLQVVRFLRVYTHVEKMRQWKAALSCVFLFRLVANYLLKHGADVSFADINGDTALHCAVRSGSLGVCVSLLDYYASCDTVNGDRETSLHEAAKGDNADIVVLLLDKKANTELKNKREKTFLDLAIDNAHDEVLDAIMNHHR